MKRMMLQRGLAVFLCVALVTSMLPGDSAAKAGDKAAGRTGEKSFPSVTAYAAPEELKNSDYFALHPDYKGEVKKVAFGYMGNYSGGDIFGSRCL